MGLHQGGPRTCCSQRPRLCEGGGTRSVPVARDACLLMAQEPHSTGTPLHVWRHTHQMLDPLGTGMYGMNKSIIHTTIWRSVFISQTATHGAASNNRTLLSPFRRLEV